MYSRLAWATSRSCVTASRWPSPPPLMATSSTSPATRWASPSRWRPKEERSENKEPLSQKSVLVPPPRLSWWWGVASIPHLATGDAECSFVIVLLVVSFLSSIIALQELSLKFRVLTFEQFVFVNLKKTLSALDRLSSFDLVMNCSSFSSFQLFCRWKVWCWLLLVIGTRNNCKHFCILF